MANSYKLMGVTMSKIALTFLSILTASLGISSVSNAQGYDGNEVKAHCGTEWADDFQMQKYCVEQMERGYESYQSMLKALPDERLDRTFSDCFAEWIPQWDMISYCAEQNVVSLRKIPNILSGVPHSVASTITEKCEADWGFDFTMVAYCAEQQVVAWLDMNG